MIDPWYLSRNNQQFGPYTWQQLLDLYQAGNILPSDMIWNPNLQQWVPSDAVSFSSEQPISQHSTHQRKYITYLILGISLIILLCVAVVFFWANLSKPSYLSGRRVSQGTIMPQSSSVEQSEDLLQILEQLEKSIHREEFLDWRNYKDLKQEKEAIEKTLNTFTSALKQKDVNGAIAWVQENRKEAYRELFNSRPEAMESFAEIISKAEINFLSAHSDLEPKNRTAEYKVVLDDFTFYVIFMKIDDQWVLYDF